MKTHFNIKNGDVVQKSTVKKAFDLADGLYELDIKKKSRRSLQQNAYYWACVVPMVREGLVNMGNDVSLEDTHEFLKARYNSKEIIDTSTGEVLSIPMSTTNLSKELFGLYIERVQRFASEYLGIVIPSPNQPILINY